MAQAEQRRHYRVTFVTLVVGVAGFALLQSLVLPVLPTIQRSLHTSQDTVTWVLTAYLLSASVFTPILGRVGDMVGKERMFVVALAALAVGCLLGAIATSIGVMIGARVIQGVGGGVLPLAFGIIRDEFPREKVGGAIGVTAALVAVGGGAGIVLAGPIVDALDYHWLFWIPMIMVTGAGVAAHFLIPESPVRSPGRLNWTAAVLLSGWLVTLLVAVSEGSVWGWASVRVLGLFVATIALMVLWVRVELASPEPLIDLQMMRLPAVWTTNLSAFLFGIGLYSAFVFVPEFVQTPASAGYGFGASITESGLFLLPQLVAMFVLGLISGRLASRFGARAVLIAGSTLSVIPFVMLAAAHSQRWEVYVAMGLLGTGFGLAFSAMSNLIVHAVPAKQTGVASGMNTNIRTIGGSIGAGVMASIVTAGLASGGVPKGSRYTYGFTVLAVTTGLAACASLLVPRVQRAPAVPPASGDFSPAELSVLRSE
jgi:EmrB/QacA subfamily drug resistance transporter